MEDEEEPQVLEPQGERTQAVSGRRPPKNIDHSRFPDPYKRGKRSRSDQPETS